MVALALVLAILTLPAAAQAEPPEFLTRLTTSEGKPGGGAGRVGSPRGIAANPLSGYVYVADGDNSRISVFTAWGLFAEAWGWGVANGGEELQRCGPSEPQVSPDSDLCQKGIEGNGKGQLSRPNGVAVDLAGNVYVFDRNNLRVQKFSPDGDFILTFGGGVNGTTGGDVCTAASGDECGKGVSGEAPSHFADTVGNYIAYSPAADAILVGDKDRIQVFDLDGTHREDIDFDVPGPREAFDGKTVNGLAVDSTGNIFISLAGSEDVFKLSPAGVPLAPGVPGATKFKAEVPLGVAVDVEGSVYVIDNPPGLAPKLEARILKYDTSGNLLVPTVLEAGAGEFFPYIPFSGPAINGIATSLCAGSKEPGNLYATAFAEGEESWADAYGSPPIGCDDPPERPPHIVDQYATEVGTESAKLRAEINPRFWADTTYYVEYGPGECLPGECAAQAPPVPAQLTTLVTQDVLDGAPVSLSGLEPATTYHYRFVAESGGGGPVYGETGGEEEKEGEAVIYREVGEEGAFTTARAPAPKAPCTNDIFRKGVGAELPDCRAYEMVSPLDKNGGDVALWESRSNAAPLYFEVHQSSTAADRFTFSSTRAFGDSESAYFTSQYLAERAGSGWGSEPITPAGTETPVSGEDMLGDNGFQLFSVDLCRAWLRHYSIVRLTKDAIPGFANLYRRENCGDSPLYEALTTAKPFNLEAIDYDELRIQGASEDGSRAIFAANDALVDDAPALADQVESLLYEHTPAGLKLACYLPGGAPSPQACSAGTAAGGVGLRSSSARNAISADGQRIFWSAFKGNSGFGNDPGAPGTIYASVAGQGTVDLSGPVSGDPAWYWTAAEDGSRVVFSIGSPVPNFNSSRAEQLYEVDVDAALAAAPGATTLLATGVQGPLGASEDASVVYFASSDDLDGPGEPGADGASNLYRHDDGGSQFVMGLAGDDIGGAENGLAPIDGVPPQRSAYVTPDGAHAVFGSIAPSPTGYENVDAETAESVQEVYRYDAEANGGQGELLCISCNPTGARPISDQGAAARIQGWEASGHAPRVMSDDGSRVFFESFEALVPRDNNGTWDVYQWSEPGKGSCTVADPTYGEAAEGCVDLISSGRSASKSTFLDADPSGNSVFIGTQGSLVASDYGLSDVYVARVGGGFPEPSPPSECEGEACQSPPPAPESKRPASEGHLGPGNLRPAPGCNAQAKRARDHVRAAKALRRRARRTDGGAAKRRLRRAAARHVKAAGRLAASARRCRAAARRSSE
jgi:DNA-binding beta-propeller fold protein YncE